MTGTPIQNSLNDLYSLIKFLRHEPWDKLRWWNRLVACNSNSNSNSNGNSNGNSNSSSGSSQVQHDEDRRNDEDKGIQVVRELLKEIMLRRTKLTLDVHGNHIVQLTSRVVSIDRISLTEGEREFYNALMEKSKRALLQANDKQKYMTAFALLMRLRQCCDHPFLVLGIYIYIYIYMYMSVYIIAQEKYLFP